MGTRVILSPAATTGFLNLSPPASLPIAPAPSSSAGSCPAAPSHPAPPRMPSIAKRSGSGGRAQAASDQSVPAPRAGFDLGGREEPRCLGSDSDSASSTASIRDGFHGRGRRCQRPLTPSFDTLYPSFRSSASPLSSSEGEEDDAKSFFSAPGSSEIPSSPCPPTSSTSSAMPSRPGRAADGEPPATNSSLSRSRTLSQMLKGVGRKLADPLASSGAAPSGPAAAPPPGRGRRADSPQPRSRPRPRSRQPSSPRARPASAKGKGRAPEAEGEATPPRSSPGGRDPARSSPRTKPPKSKRGRAQTASPSQPAPAPPPPRRSSLMMDDSDRPAGRLSFSAPGAPLVETPAAIEPTRRPGLATDPSPALSHRRSGPRLSLDLGMPLKVYRTPSPRSPAHALALAPSPLLRQPDAEPGGGGIAVPERAMGMYRLSEASRSAPSLVSSRLGVEGDEAPEWVWPASASVLALAADAGVESDAPRSGGGGGGSSNSSTRRLHERSQSYGAATAGPPASCAADLSKEPLRLERRFQALLELYDKEVAYRRDLRVLVYVFLDTVERAPFVGGDDKRVVRRNADQVLELGERIERRLKLAAGSKLDGWRDAAGGARDEDEVDRVIERIAKAFVSESPIFSVYEEFCARHAEAMDVIRQIEGMPEWASWASHPARSPGAQAGHSPGGSSGVHPAPSTAATIAAAASLALAHNPAIPDKALPDVAAALAGSRLSLQDTAIKPIQQVMRYPLLLGGLLAQMHGARGAGEERARERVGQALAAMRGVAEAVNEAKRARDSQRKTEMIAARMELHSSYRTAFVSLLGQIQLVGSLHVLYHGPTLDPNEAFKIKYHGIFLYQTHLLVAKVKRATVYEPRHWFPVRYFDIVDVAEGSGLMPHSFCLRCRPHTFEFGATCEQEKYFWLSQLRYQVKAVNANREAQLGAGIPLNDDSIVSSINLDESSTSLAAPASSDGRSLGHATTAPTSPLLSTIRLPDDSLTPTSDGHDDDGMLATPASGSPAATPPAATPRVSQRLSRNVNSLLGRTPAVAQAAIDLKLTEVFSDSLLALRTQAAREQAAQAELAVRRRTLSSTNPAKRPPFGSATFNGRQSERKMKRASVVEMPVSFGVADAVPPLPTADTHVFPCAGGSGGSHGAEASSSLLRRASYGHSRSASDIPSAFRQSWRLSRASTTPAPTPPQLPVDLPAELPAGSGSGSGPVPVPVPVPCEGEADRAGVERSGSSGSSSSASSAGPTTPRPAPAQMDAFAVAVAPEGSSGSTTPSIQIGGASDGLFGSMFSRKKHAAPIRPAAGSPLDAPPEDPAPPEPAAPPPHTVAEGLTLASRTPSGSWLPGFQLVRRLSQARGGGGGGGGGARRADSTAASPQAVPPLPSPPKLSPAAAAAADAAPLPSADQRVAEEPATAPSSADGKAEPPRKKLLKAFLRMTPMHDE